MLIGFLEPLTNTALARSLAQKGVTSFAMESIPRITRAQSMDALSSQANLGGYMAVLIAAPLSGHYATLLRGTVQAFLQDHAPLTVESKWPLTLLTLDAWDFVRIKDRPCADCGGSLTLASLRLGISIPTLSRWRASGSSSPGAGSGVSHRPKSTRAPQCAR